MLNINRIRTEGSPRVNIAKARWLDAWTPTNQDAKYPRVGENPEQVGTNNFTSDLLEDGSYLRLRTLTLSYGVPRSLLRRSGVTTRALYVTGTNLFTVSDYSGFDPDVSGAVGRQHQSRHRHRRVSAVADRDARAELLLLTG